MVDWASIEEKWQKKWRDAGVFEPEPDRSKEKFFITVPYPYPNAPQHIGHGRTYTLTDVHARYLRMRGYNVLLPMAFHYTGTPVLAMTKRLKEKDQDLIDTFLNVWKMPESDLKKVEEPLGMARYFHEELKNGMQKMGYSIDWRREFTTVDPYYHKFIEWQFTQLKKGGYVTQGSHPVGWCPECGNPVGQHDTKGDVEPEIEEFVLLKFQHMSRTLPAATLRPETVFGVTNMWLNPQAKYVNAKVDDEDWIVSEDSVQKLILLGHRVEVENIFKGEELIGQKTKNPMTGSEVLILPASFVDPKNATGVVMSVPGHAPYDFVALENLKKDPSLKKYGLRPSEVKSIDPISLIELEGYSDWPAIDEVKKRRITDQSDPALENATKEVYRQEFHLGRMKSNTGPYAGIPVQKAKDYVKADMVKEGKASTMYELANRPVFCRCGGECVVKIFENQWFINYGDPKWKILVHQNLEKMDVTPKDMRTEFEHVIDWLNEKACARKAGLGTSLPWDPSWIIESLSDSTIYMAFYTIVNRLKSCNAEADKLSNSFFNYVFLGKGSPKRIAETTGLKIDDIKGMRKEFKYFYPLDSRHSGRDLVPNHLTFMMFNHTAIFPESLWPRQIVVNGSVLMEGEKMSKSLGNIIPLVQAIRQFGADPTRFSLMATSEILKDVDFSVSLAKSTAENLDRFYQNTIEIASKGKPAGEPTDEIDLWMLSKLQKSIWETTENMESLKVRSAVHSSFYNLNQDLQWYMRRVAPEKNQPTRVETIQNVLYQVARTQTEMLAPIIPHLCEEIWEALGNTGFVCVAEWPAFHVDALQPKIEDKESVVKECLEDVQSISKVTQKVPSQVYFYVAASWKWAVYQKALELAGKGSLNVGELIHECLRSESLKKRPDSVASFARDVVDEVRKTPEESVKRRLNMGGIEELDLLRKAQSFFETELNAEVHVEDESDPTIHDPEGRAKRARPYRPAIYIVA